jgi:hypothetical protein
MSIYQLLKAGHTVTVKNEASGKTFSFRPESVMGFVMGYSVVENGRVVPGRYRKKFVSEREFWLMTNDLTIMDDVA